MFSPRNRRRLLDCVVHMLPRTRSLPNRCPTEITMAHKRDELVTFKKFEAEIRKLETLLAKMNIKPTPASDLATLARRGFAVLYYSMFAGERPDMTSKQAIEEGASLAGLGDLAAKINRARKHRNF